MILSGVLNTHPDCLATNCNWQDLLTVARPLLVTVGPPTMELLAREDCGGPVLYSCITIVTLSRQILIESF